MLSFSTVSFRFQRYCHRFYGKNSRSNLVSILKNMPTERTHVANAQKQRIKIKERNSKYVPGRVTLQVLGTGAKGAPRALYVFSDQSRFLFNCGEGTQRLAHEHKMKLARLEHVFITQPVWKNIGGLPGTALTIQDVGVPEIVLHGPAGLNEIFVATKRFVVLRDLKIKMARCDEKTVFEDNVMKVRYVPLSRSEFKENSEVEDESEGNEKSIQVEVNCEQSDACTSTRTSRARKKRNRSASSSGSEDIFEDDTDYYAHAQNSSRQSADELSSLSQELLKESKGKGIAMTYICHLQPKPGALNLEKCVNMGVPPGPLLGKLKSGETVTLPNGNVVKTEDVCEPDDPGPVFIVVDCPSEEYLTSLVTNPELQKRQKFAEQEQDIASLVVHFTPAEVMDSPRYKLWMNDFPSFTNHICLNESNVCMGSAAVHRIQHQLNLLSDEFFPLLGDRGTGSCNVPSCDDHVSKKARSDGVASKSNECRLYCVNTLGTYSLRPKSGFDRSLEVRLEPEEYINESMILDNFPEVLKDVRVKLSEKRRTLNVRDFPKIIFLGTGSCIPNKTRNTSGILLQLSDSDNVLLDCGEGTSGQILRFFGPERGERVLANIKAIYISHLHADHHIGLVGLLQSRRDALESSNVDKKPVYLFAPKQILAWLTFYNNCFETIKNDYVLVPNGEIMMNGQVYEESAKAKVLNEVNLGNIETCYVKHCPNAFGVTLTTENGCKITYSGDTMPSENLIELGKGTDVLIHEATMEDDLAHEAIVKMHSTTSQAIEVGKKMQAKHIILTHFSQRYAKLPMFNDNFSENVSIAFDNMQVKVDELPLVPILYDALKTMFAEHYEELEHKAAKRQMKLERERSASCDRKVKQKV